MITVISGYRRSGTSMMVKALHEGGLGALYAPAMEEANPTCNGYTPNPGGLWEVGAVAYLDAKFLRMIPDGALIKILFDGLPNLPKGNWKVIFMYRDPSEITESYRRVDEHIVSTGKESAFNHEITRILPFCAYRTYDQEAIDHVLGICEARKDIEVINVNYLDVVQNPESSFERIKYYPSGKLRIDIDVGKASNVVDSKLYRVRNDDSQNGRYRLRADSKDRASTTEG